MSKIVLAMILFVFSFIVRSAYAQTVDNENKAWTMYIAIGPKYADIFNAVNAGENLDIRKYKYPLYVGYFYSMDSKSIQWKSFEPFVEPAMKDWAEWQNRIGGGVYYDHEIPYKGKKITFNFDDEEYVEVAERSLVRHQGLFSIRTVRGELPNELWRPKFKHQYTIDFYFDNSTAFKLDRIMRNDEDAWDIEN